MNNNPELNNNGVQNNNVQPTPVQPTVPVQPTMPVQPTAQVPVTPVAQNTPVQQVVPTVTNNEVQPNEPEKKNGIALLLIIGLIVVIVATVVYFYFIKNNDSEKNDSNGNQTNEPTTPEEENTDNIDLSVWNGVYVYDNISITIYQSADDMVYVDISTSSTDNNTVSGTSIGLDIDATSETKLVYDDDFLEDGANIVIERTDNGIMVTASSDETDSLLNNINGSYEKRAFTEYGWSGTYKNGDISVILSEVYENYVTCVITKGYSVVSFAFDTVSATELIHEDSWDNETIKVVMNEVGFELTAATEDPDSLLNEVNGMYTKE